MMKVKQIDSCGGACPYQCEGILEDGRIFYLRYRWGHLILRVAEYQESIWANESVKYNKLIGSDMEGWADNEKFHKELDGIIEFPEGFVFEYDYK